MTWVAWILLLLAAVYVIGAPFTIGEARPPRTAGDYVSGLIHCALAVAASGRVLGWF